MLLRSSFPPWAAHAARSSSSPNGASRRLGRCLHLHTVPVLVSIIAGLILFGASGIVIGPLLLAVTDMLVKIWRRRLRIQAGGDTTAVDGSNPSRPHAET